MLRFLDYSFAVLHSATVLAVVLLWIPRRTRRLHRWVVGLTLASWVGLGAVYGWGYCFLTDWHWSVKDRLGEPHPNSFIQYALEAWFNLQLPPPLVDTATALVLVAVTLAATILWFRERRPLT